MKTKTFRTIFCFLITLSIPILSLCNTGVIKKVLSGDLIQVGDTFVARLTGLTTPSINNIIGSEVYDFTKRELEGKKVKFSTWTKNNTVEGIVLDDVGYPFVEILYGIDLSISFNEILLKKGYARVDSAHLPKNLSHYFELEKEARKKRIGIWK
ncbi:thermonuclease family protein [Acidobacteriota bacterium]